MRSFTRTIVVVSLALAVLAPTAGGAAASSSTNLHDEVGDVPRDSADSEFARIRYEPTALVVSMRMVRFTDPLRHPAWVDGYTNAVWILDAEPGAGDAAPDFFVRVATIVPDDGTPRFRGWVHESFGEPPVCSGRARANEVARTYSFSIPPRCVDRSDRVRFAAYFEWDRTPDDAEDDSWIVDTVEGDECTPYNYTCAYYSNWAQRP